MRLSQTYATHDMSQSVLVKSQSRTNPRLTFIFIYRFDLRFLRFFRADLSIRKSSSFFPPLIAATSQRGLAPRPAQVSPDAPRYFGGTFLPFNALPPRTTLLPPTKAMGAILSNCFSSSARRLWRVSSTRFRRSMSASTVIRDRFTFGIVISGIWPTLRTQVGHLLRSEKCQYATWTRQWAGATFSACQSIGGSCLRG